MFRGFGVRDVERCCGGGVGRGFGCEEGIGVYCGGLWVVVLYLVRLFSYIYLLCGVFFGLVMV